MSCTVADLLPVIAPYVGDSGVCVDTAKGRSEAIAALNFATEHIIKRLDSKGTLWYWCVTVTGGIFCLPTDCLEPRQVWLDGASLVQRDEFFEGKLHVGIQDEGTLCNAGELIDLGDGYAIPKSLPKVDGLRVCLVAEDSADAGKSVTILVQNGYGDEMNSAVALLDNAMPAYVYGSVRDVLSLHKGETVGNVKLQIEFPSGLRYNWALYENWVVNASFRRKKLPKEKLEICQGSKLLIKGKRRFRNVSSDNDFCLICDTAALAFGFMAMNAMKLRDPAAYNTNMQFSVNELNKELSNSVAPASSGALQFGMQLGFRRIGAGKGFC